MTQPTKLELTLDFDKHLAQFIQYDEDGDPIHEPTTVEDLVIERAARVIAAQAAERDARNGTTALRVREVRDEVIREKVAPLVDAVLAKALQPTNAYGEPTGQPMTLTEHIVAEATKQLTATVQDRNRSSFGHPKTTALDEAISAEVKRVIAKELADALAEARKQVLKVVTDQGAAIIRQAVERSVAK